MPKVWLIQLLCPTRHAIMASPYERDGESQLSVISDGIKDEMKRLGFNWECGICKSADLHFEEGPTRFTTVAEAMPHLKRIEEENILTRLLIDEARNAPGSKP